jgi:hypothetical protein
MFSPGWRIGRRTDGQSARPRPTRLRGAKGLAYGMDRAPTPLKEDGRQTRRDLRAAVVFGIVAASIELGVILYFMW